MNVTIIIPTYNEEKYIRDTIEAALRVTNDVIVVDDNSTDATQAIVGTTRARLLIKPLSHRKGKSGSINYAAQYVDTEFTIIIDADTIIESHQDIIAKLEGGADLVGCNVGIYTDERLISQLESDEYDFVIGQVRPLLKKLGYINTVSGAYLGIRTELLQGNPVPPEVNGEDMYLTQIGRQQGWNIQLATSQARTYAIPSIKALLVQRARWITGTVSVIRATGNKLPIVELLPYFYNVAALLGGFLGGLYAGNGLLGLLLTLFAWFTVNLYITKSPVKALAYLAYAQLNTVAFILSPILGRTWKVNR
jgi:cellulose synthase/poly-beta-1,6-N-acetylglucosamine synthase-like glycosyltransferase